jgi:hypothetical protein
MDAWLALSGSGEAIMWTLESGEREYVVVSQEEEEEQQAVDGGKGRMSTLDRGVWIQRERGCVGRGITRKDCGPMRA